MQRAVKCREIGKCKGPEVQRDWKVQRAVKCREIEKCKGPERDRDEISEIFDTGRNNRVSCAFFWMCHRALSERV